MPSSSMPTSAMPFWKEPTSKEPGLLKNKWIKLNHSKAQPCLMGLYIRSYFLCAYLLIVEFHFTKPYRYIKLLLNADNLFIIYNFDHSTIAWL